MDEQDQILKLEAIYKDEDFDQEESLKFFFYYEFNVHSGHQ